MKILHICTGWPLSYQGGITNYVRVLAKEQAKNGIEVHVLGGLDEKKNEYNFVYKEYTSKIRTFSYSPLVDKKALEEIRKYLEKEQFDIIHIHSLVAIDWDIYEVIKEYHYIVSLHDYCFICPRTYMFTEDKNVCSKYDKEKCKKCISYLDRIDIVRKGINKLNRMYKWKIKIPYVYQNITNNRYEKFICLLNNAEYVLPVSKRVEQIYKDSGVISKSKVLHIGNVSADNYIEEYEYNDKKHKIKIVFLGRLTVYKGADLFIEIVNKLSKCENVEFHFHGDSQKYSKQLKEAGVINHGRYNQKELTEILKKYDMGMVLSIWEDNGPQVVMELLNNHIPVIGTKMGGIPDFVNDKNGYLFNPYSEDEIELLVEYIKKLDVNTVSKLKRNIQPTTTTKEHYEKLIEIYNEVIC